MLTKNYTFARSQVRPILPQLVRILYLTADGMKIEQIWERSSEKNYANLPLSMAFFRFDYQSIIITWKIWNPRVASDGWWICCNINCVAEISLLSRPIHDAAEGGHVAVLRVLLSYGADPLLATYSGSTALSCAKEPNTRAFLEGVWLLIYSLRYARIETKSLPFVSKSLASRGVRNLQPHKSVNLDPRLLTRFSWENGLITWVDCLGSSRGIGAIVRVNQINVLSIPKPSIFYVYQVFSRILTWRPPQRLRMKARWVHVLCDALRYLWNRACLNLWAEPQHCPD